MGTPPSKVEKHNGCKIALAQPSTTYIASLSPSLPSRKFLFDQEDQIPSHFRFLDLPIDLRVMIYDECLIVGKVFYTPGRHDIRNGKRCDNYELFRKPELQLLRVCKQIHAEAEPVYLSKNLFVLPVHFAKPSPITEKTCIYPRQEFTRYLFSEEGFTHIKNISIAVDQTQVERRGYSHEDWNIESIDDTPFEELSQHDRYNRIHFYDSLDLERTWRDDLGFLVFFINKMDYLEIDFTNAFCPTGCCRLFGCPIAFLFGTIRTWQFHVIGLRNEGEEEEFLSEIEDFRGYPQILYDQFGLHFKKDGEGTRWDSYLDKYIEDGNQKYVS